MKMQLLQVIRLVMFLSVLSGGALMAQDQAFQIEISSDSVYHGNVFEIRYSAQNISGSFEPPSFDGFDVIRGPNQTNRMQFVNGVTSQSSSYSYVLRPTEPGVLFLPPAFYVTDEKTWETSPMEIFCLPNPEGIEQNHFLSDDNQAQFPGWFGGPQVQPPAKKKKLKVTKI